MEKFFEEFPEEREYVDQMRLKVKDILLEYQTSNHTRKEIRDLVTIPVVFQVLYSQDIPESKITRAQALQEIEYLNQWYSASNTYYSTTSNMWSSVTANANDFQIQFALATEDPDGNPTNGMVYRETPVAITCGDYEIFREEEGGLDLWNSLHYMNMYTCTDLDGAAGYAYYPISQPHERDAMVLDPQYVGSSQITGSIVAHEAGHWLNLRHTFEGCNDADMIPDTPDTNQPAFNYVTYSGGACPGQNGKTDSDFFTCSINDLSMVQNCMDYNYEPCKTLFTKGQVNAMRYQLDTSSTTRYSLRSSNGLNTDAVCANFDCTNRECGDNGCGGVCGTCSLNSELTTCSSSGICVAPGDSPAPAPAPGPAPAPDSPAPPPPASNSLSDMRNTILTRHNEVRSSVEPAATSALTPLTYSQAAENFAQSYVANCNWGHSSGSGFGENLYAITGDRTDDLVNLMTLATTSWENEKAYYHVEDNTCDAGQVCGHYKQMIWNHASYPTTQVGCYYQYCTTGSPFSSFSEWTLVSCNYAGPGNYIGLSPYEPCDNCVTTCSSSCQPGQCGIITTECGETIDCGCCDNPCDSHECGTVANSCGEQITCSTCSNGSSCAVGDSGFNECISAPDCHAAACEADGITCGFVSYCGINARCGDVCPDGSECQSGTCVELPPTCNCGTNAHCNDNDVCECDAGFTLSNGNCISVPSGGGTTPDFSSMFTQTSPAGTVSFTVPDTTILLSENGPHILNWDASSAVVDPYTTTLSVDIELASGEFGFNIRYNQGAGRENDRIMWHIKGIGSSPSMGICLVYYGNAYCGSYYGVNFPTSGRNTIRVTMGNDGAGSILTTFRINSDTTWSSYISESYYPQLGSISYLISPSNGATAFLEDVILATSSVLDIVLTDCIDDSEWEALFYDLTGADPQTTSVQIRDSGENGNCAKSAGKVLVSGFTTVITSGSVSAQALSSTLVSSLGGPGAASIGLQSAVPITGPAAASAAGLPASIASLGTVIQTPGVVGSGAAAGAAGAGAAGASGGLSGGSIAGIVVGSVAGAILLAGVATLVVVGVVAVAVLSSSDEGDDEGPSRADDSDKRKSVRKTLRGFFGGVDVMNDPKGHQSISARSPAM